MENIFSRRTFYFCALVCLLLASITSVSGCGSCLGTRNQDGQSSAQSPSTPRAAQRQTVASPRGWRRQSPQTPATQAEPAIVHEILELNVQTAQDIKTGMSYEEIRTILGDPGVVIAGTDAENVVYRWSYSGMSFMGRFENGVLVRKNAVQNDEEHLPFHDEDTFSFDKELYDKVQPGMSYDEVLALIGMDAQPLTTSSGRVKIYKWSDERGSSITGRFEDQVLKRKSGLILEPEKEGLAELAEEAPEAISAESVVAKDQVAPEAYDEDVYEDSAGFQDDGTDVAQDSSGQDRSSRVSISGSSRRNRNQEASGGNARSERSYQPKVKLPDFKRRLREGVYEIRIHNTTDSSLKVALISEEGGLEMRLAAGRHSSAKVGQGNYQIYFINENDPFTLHQGQSIPVAEFLSDFSVYLFEDAYDVDFLNKNAPASSARR